MDNDSHRLHEAPLRAEARSFLTAMQYFTRVPAPAWIGHSPDQLNRAARYFPVIGMLVGAVGALVCHVAALLFPAPLAVLLSMVATVWLTGAFHEDGLADTFDGLGGGATRERALAIMKDSRLGTYGTLALVLVLAIKTTALSALPIPLAGAALVGAHALSRCCALLVIGCRNYARDACDMEHSRAKPVVDRLDRSHLLVGALFGLIALIAAAYYIAGSSTLLAWLICVPLCAVLGMTAYLIRWFTRRLGGYTGDTLGATQQLTEVMFYLAWLATWNSY